nr:MAG TPA: crystallin beta/gamma motif-containing protein [Caudoviricetes sp.]
MSQNPFMSVEKKGVLSPSTNPFMGITLEDSDFEQSQKVSPDQIEAVASGDLSATGYEPDPQVIAEFQRVPQINIPEEAFAGYVPDTSAPDFSGLRVSDTAFEGYAPERMGQPSDEAQALVSSLAGNFNRNAEMVFSDAEYAAHSESQQRRRQVEADLAQDLDLRARTVAETFPNPLPAVELSNKTGIPVGTVLENHREIARVYDAAQNGPTRRAALEKLIRDEPITGRWLVQQGAAMIAGLGDQLPEIGAFERLSQEMQEANRVGRLQIEQTDLLNKVFWQDNPDPADLQRIDQINWELSINQAYRQDESFLMGAYRSSFSTFVPQVAEGAYRSILGGAQAGAAAGIAASAFGPISGVSAGSAFAAGAGAAGIRYAFEMSLGEIYGSLSQLKDENGQPLPRDEVRLLSFLGTLPSGALEVVGVHKALSLIPGADKLLNRATVASAQQLLSKNPSLLKAVGKGTGEALGALATEVGVETTQEGISIITEDAAKQISGQPFRLTTGEEAVDRLSEAAYEALKAFVLPIGVGGGAIRTRAAFRESRQARNESNALQTLADHASNNKLITESPTAAEQLVSQLKEEGKIGDLYVNPEAMQRVLFQSDEGLQIAQRIGLSAEDVADALALGTRVAVPMEKAVPYLLNTAQGKELLQDSTLDPSVMTPGELQEATAGMTQEQIAQVDALNSFFDFVDSSIEQAQNSRESFDTIAAPYVQQMRDAGYSESQARHYGDLLAANAERMAPMYGMEPAAWLESRLQGIQLIDPNAPAQDVLDARAQRAFARQPLVEKDPLLALVWGRLDGKTLSSSYNADTLKEITRSKGRGLFKSKEKGGISIDELADEAVRRGLLPEGSGADELVERLKQDNAYHQFIDPARVQANPNARDVVPVLRRVFHMNTMELDDSKATVTVPREEGMSGPLTDIYQHDALYELYPELLDAQYEVVPEERLPGKLAGYSPKYGTIYITTDPDVTPSVIAHEVQHAIQDVDERFDFGLSEEASQEVYSQVEQELKGKLPLERARVLAARIQYLSQAHEIQAFDTQNRFELTADERAKYEPNNPSTYYQNIRGKIEPTANGKWLISVFKGKKNLSTVIHETGHFFLENLRDAAALETAPDWVKNDWAAIKGELGIKDDGFIEREAHEKFARQFEAYAREGKAPRPELQSAFNQFRAWLTAIYRSVRRLLGDAELSADVRAVFDRLLASEEDIASARKRGAPEPVIERASEALGIPTERLSAYREAVSRGMQKGQAEIALRRMREQKQVEYEARGEARDFIESAPFYRGMRDLSMSGGIDWQSLIGMATEDLAWQLREKWNAGRGKNIVQQRGGMTLDDAAAYLGVRDGTEVLAALMNEPTAREYTETHVQSKVAEWEKVYSPDFEFVNDAMDEALRVEIESLGGNAGPTTKHLRDVVDKRVGVKKGSVVDAEYKALTAAVRKQKRLIEEAVREVRREERAAARERVKTERAGQRWSDAAKNARIDELRSRLAQLKEEERLKRAALGAAYRARIERNQTTRQIRRIAQSKSIPDTFKQQILSLIAHFPGLGTERMAPRPDENRPTLLQFQEALGVEYSLDDTGGASPIASWIFEEAQRQGPRRASDLSLSELRDVYDAIKILARQGRTQDALIGMLHEQELNQAVAEAVAPMASLSETKHITADERNRLPGALRSWFRDSLANMKVMRYLFDAADGYRADHDGPNSRLIVQPLQRAASQEQELFRSFGTSLRTLLEPITSRGMHKTFSIDGVRMLPDVEREFGGQWTMERVLSVALNMGNDGNLAALQRGYNWNTQDLELITRRMTSAEWRFVQSVWDLIDKLYPVINATYQQLYGVPLRRVEAKPFTVVSSDGETIFMRGGYYSLRFDKRFSEAAQRNSDFDDLNSREDILRTPNPRSGMTQERKGAGLPPLLSLSVLTSYVADAIHYGTHTLPLLDAYRIVKRPEYRRAMQRAFGDEAYAQVVPWLRSIARPDRTKIDGINKMFEFLARRGSLAAMGFSFRTALLQTTSIPQSMAEVGTGAFLRGAYHMLVHPLESWGTIRELSPYMVSRSRNMERDVADRLKPFREGTKIFGSKWEEAAFAMIQAMDAIVAYPTWMAKYNDAIGKGVEQSKAVLMADDAVIRAQGSGLVMDTTALMRKPGAARLFTMFMSFAMNWQNRQRYYFSGFRESLRTGQSEIGTARFLSHFALEWLAPPILTLLLIGMGRDGEFPELEDIGSELLGYWLMGVPIVREIPALFEYNKKFGDSAAFKGLNAAVTATRGGMKIAAGEASDEQFYRTMKSTLDAIGFVAGVPTAPIWRTVEGTEAFIEGKAGPLAPILGAPPKDKQKRTSAF